MTEQRPASAAGQGQPPGGVGLFTLPESRSIVPLGREPVAGGVSSMPPALSPPTESPWQPATTAPDGDRSLRERFGRIGLHHRISLFVALGLALCLAVFGLLGLQAVTEATNRELRERLLVARMAAGQIDRTLLDTLRSLEAMAASLALDPNGVPSEASLRTLRLLHPRTDLAPLRLTLLGPDGTVIASDPADAGLVGRSLLSDPYVARAFERGQPSVSNLRTGPSGNHVVALTSPILAADGRITGALSWEFDFSDPSLLAFLQPLQLGSTGKVQIIDEQGNVLGATSKDSRSEQVIEHQRFAGLIQQGVPSVGLCHDCHTTPAGIERRQDVMAFAPLQVAPLGILLRQSADEAFATVNDLRWKMLAFGVLLLIGGLLLAQLTTQGVVKPIEVLTRTAQRIAKGDLDSPVPVVGHSEVAVLAAVFDEMRERLRASRAEVELWNETLEQRVLQRTRELSALLQLANTLTSTLDLDTLLAYIMTRAAETFRAANAGALLLYDRGQDQLLVRSSIGVHPTAIRRLRLRPGEGVAGKVFAAGRELLCTHRAEIAAATADLSEANQRALEQAMVDLAPQASCVCAPLVAKDRPIGCLLLLSPEEGTFTESDLRLLRAMADQAAVAVETAQLYQDVRRSEEARGELLAKLIGAQEEERRRIARELHDETSQALTALLMSLAQLRKVTPPSLPAVHAAIDELDNLAGLTLDEIHRLIYDLRPTVLDDLGLVPAIQWCLDTGARKAGLQTKLHVDGLDERLPSQTETVLFRIIQEAITNVVRHAQASVATVRVRLRDGAVTASIEDDGRGFDARAFTKKTSPGGLGIVGMKERVNLLGGRFSIVSRPGRGTKLSVEVPVATRDREHDPSIVG